MKLYIKKRNGSVQKKSTKFSIKPSMQIRRKNPYGKNRNHPVKAITSRNYLGDALPIESKQQMEEMRKGNGEF